MSFVTGFRDDDTPNLSHAWARTIEGAQGGTWEAVHLLGTASLDALSGYVGQSRGRRPTHTWNTRPTPDVDLGGVLADDRDGSERVLAALTREPDATFAADDDPWPADRRLRAARDEHMAVLARCPEDRGGEHREAEETVGTARSMYACAEDDVRRAEEGLRDVGPLRRVRAPGRFAHARAEDRLAEARGLRDGQQTELAEAERRVSELVAHQSARKDFLARDGWRIQRIADIEAELSRHWAPVILAAVRHDDPLAFGVERLRAARATYVDDLDRLRRSLPPDRSDSLEKARGEARAARRAVALARSGVAAAEATVEEARQRHWGRRDHAALDRARPRAERADAELLLAFELERRAKDALAKEVDADRAHREALRRKGPALDALEEAVADLAASLDHTRGERVVAMMSDGDAHPHLTGVLGPVPETPPGMQLWCALAYEIEAYRDLHASRDGSIANSKVQVALGPRPDRFEEEPAWDYLASRISVGVDIIATTTDLDAPAELGTPDHWSQRLDRAVAERQPVALAPEPTGLHL